MRLLQVPHLLVMCRVSGKTVQQAYKVGSAIWRLTKQHCTLIESWETPLRAYLSYILDLIAKFCSRNIHHRWMHK